MNPDLSEKKTSEPPLESLPSLHSPGRSKTISAWGALIALLLLIVGGFFYSFLLKESIQAVLWISQPLIGVTIQAELLKVQLGKPLRWKNIVITSGGAPHESRLELQTLSLELTPLSRMLFGDHAFLNKIEASSGKGLFDFRREPSAATPSCFQQQRAYLREMLGQRLTELPPTVALHDLSLLCVMENQRYGIDHFSCTLSKKEPGKLSYESMLIEAGTIRCHLVPTACETYWDGKTIAIKNLHLAENVLLHHLQITPYSDHLELGLAATLFHGLLRADGRLKKNGSGPILDGALLGEQLPMDPLSKFLGLPKKISGTLREGRLIFRGSLVHPLDAEASLRMLVDHLRLEKKDWASLSIAANLIGRKISLTNFQLKQQENHLNATGEMSLPEKWHQLGEAPFHLKLNATIDDASQLTDLMGPPWSDITGKIFMDGDVNGAANRAEGYFHLQGLGMMLHDLPIDTAESMLLFQGEKTTLTNFDLWSGNNHLQFSGTMENSWPHQYEAAGTLNCFHFFEKIKPLAEFTENETKRTLENNEGARAEIISNESQNANETSSSSTSITELWKRFDFLKNIRGGLLQASWNGHGTATTHAGSFEIKLQDASQENRSLSFYSLGSYAPALLSSPTLNIGWNKKTLSTSLTLTPHTVSLDHLKVQEEKRSTLEGNITLPLDGLGFLRGKALPSLFEWNTPMEATLALHHFSFDDIASYFHLSALTTWASGRIQASGLWSEPSLDMVLNGARKNAEHDLPFQGQLHVKKGTGLLDASCRNEYEKLIHVQGSLPIGLTQIQEGAPLKTKNQLALAPTSVPLHLTLTLPESRLDFLSEAMLPPDFTVAQGTLAGELLLQGTVLQPALSGHLEAKAAACTLGSFFPSLKTVKAKFLLSKEKIRLENFSAFLGTGKLEASGTSSGALGEMHHDYHFSGHDLLFYQKEHILACGDATLLLQGDAQGGKLSGKATLTELFWKPELTLVPYLLPPGMLIPSASPAATAAATWTNDLTLQYQPAAHSSNHAPQNSSLKKIDLHFVGPLFSPAPEGTLELAQASLQAPQGPMKLLEGSLHFYATQPWHPFLQLTAKATLGEQTIITHLNETPQSSSLFFENTPPCSQATAALLLAKPSDDFSTMAAGWIAELPYWIRQQEINEPTTLPEKESSFTTDSETAQDLGFSGFEIFVTEELK